MELLGIDIGSSSVKAAIVRDYRIVGEISRVAYRTRMSGGCAEVEAREIVRAVIAAVRAVTHRKTVDAVGMSVMGPAWLAMDGKGNALTPIVTHQDRRSVGEAREIEKQIGKARHLRIAGNRPFPGGISSTTCAWFVKHERSTIRRASTLGHLNTFLLWRMTGARVTDPSNASFTGLYETAKLGSWNDELCDAVGISKSKLPEVRWGNEVAGKMTAKSALELGLKDGLPVLVGVMDGSAGMLVTRAGVGQLLNVTGSTDVLALCTSEARPRVDLLTRALGIDRKWVSVATIAAAGSAVAWIKDQFFHEMDWVEFKKLMSKLCRASDVGGVEFDPYLAGSRTSIEQPTGAIRNLTLGTTRENLLSASLESLARLSAARLEVLSACGARMRTEVVCSGGVNDGLQAVMHRDWPKRFRFVREESASLRGLSGLLG